MSLHHKLRSRNVEMEIICQYIIYLIKKAVNIFHTFKMKNNVFKSKYLFFYVYLKSCLILY